MAIIRRAERAAFRFSGPDAEKLLNDVITGVVRAEPGPGRWWALLSPQGKIAAEGLIGWTDGAFWLDVHVSVADGFLRRMKMYRLRARADIDDLRPTHVVGWAGEPGPGTLVHQDARTDTLGWRLIAPEADTAGWAGDESAWQAARIASGIVELGADFGPDANFAHDIGMDLLGGIDFSKGCYVGQEVVSRMKHRGTARRRPVIVRGRALEPGQPVLAGGREAGQIGQVAAGAAVGILRLDRIADPLAASVGDEPVALRIPPWANYSFGEAGEPE